MKTERIIEEVARLDGRCVDGITIDGQYYETIPHRGSPDDAIEVFTYLTSRDAIVPVIEKELRWSYEMFIEQLKSVLYRDWKAFGKTPDKFSESGWLYAMITATPTQLCEALLRAVNKWEES